MATIQDICHLKLLDKVNNLKKKANIGQKQDLMNAMNEFKRNPVIQFQDERDQIGLDQI